MLEPTEFEIEPLVVDDQPYTGVAVRYGRAWLGFVMTNTIDGTEYVHLPRGADATPVPAPPDWPAQIRRPLPPAADPS
jgi:hypothetical protein